jgi:hypothetical protein
LALFLAATESRTVYSRALLRPGMPVPRREFEDLRPLSFRDPSAVLDPDELYTVYEIARLLQGLDPGAELDIETEEVLLDWAIPWMMLNAESFVFAEPRSEAEPGHYGLER